MPRVMPLKSPTARQAVVLQRALGYRPPVVPADYFEAALDTLDRVRSVMRLNSYVEVLVWESVCASFLRHGCSAQHNWYPGVSGLPLGTRIAFDARRNNVWHVAARLWDRLGGQRVYVDYGGTDRLVWAFPVGTDDYGNAVYQTSGPAVSCSAGGGRGVRVVKSRGA